MSKEMLEAFRVMDNQKVQRLNSMKKLEISVFIRFVKWWMKSLIAV